MDSTNPQNNNRLASNVHLAVSSRNIAIHCPTNMTTSTIVRHAYKLPIKMNWDKMNVNSVQKEKQE